MTDDYDPIEDGRKSYELAVEIKRQRGDTHWPEPLSPNHFAIKESAVQRQLLDWLHAACPNAIVFAVPNGEHRNKITAAKLKGQGVKAGAPDLIVADSGVIAFVEVKTGKGRLSEAQKAFRDACAEHRLPYGVVRGIGDLQAFLSEIGIRTRVAA